MASSLLIHHATLLTPTGWRTDAWLWIENGLIRALGNPADGSTDLPSGLPSLDAGGNLLTPGFVELQINGALGQDFTEDPESIWRLAAELPRFGITAFLPTIVTAPLERIAQAQAVWQRGEPEGFAGAIPLGLHLEGPFLNPLRKGAHNPAYLRIPDPALVADWSPQTGVRLATLAPELPGALETIRTLHAQGVKVSAGHSMATYAQAQAGFDAGIKYGTHLFNAMPPLEHRAPNLPGALLTHPGIGVGIIADGIHVHPAAVQLAWMAKGAAGEITLVTDAMAALGMPAGKYTLGDFDVQVDDSSARLRDGTLAGSILQPTQAIRNLQTFSGCTQAQAIAAFSANPARVLGLTDRGIIARAARADLVMLSAQGEVLSTFVAGKQVYKS